MHACVCVQLLSVHAHPSPSPVPPPLSLTHTHSHIHTLTKLCVCRTTVHCRPLLFAYGAGGAAGPPRHHRLSSALRTHVNVHIVTHAIGGERGVLVDKYGFASMLAHACGRCCGMHLQWVRSMVSQGLGSSNPWLQHCMRTRQQQPLAAALGEHAHTRTHTHTHAHTHTHTCPHTHTHTHARTHTYMPTLRSSLTCRMESRVPSTFRMASPAHHIQNTCVGARVSKPVPCRLRMHAKHMQWHAHFVGTR